MTPSYHLLDAGGQRVLEVRPGSPREVGRSLASDLPLFDPTISRRQVTLEVVADGLRVIDLASCNGTFLNHRRVTSAVARDGDLLTLGGLSLRVCREPEPPPAARDAPPGRRERQATGTRIRTIQSALQQAGAADLLLARGEPQGTSLLAISAQIRQEREALKYSLLLEVCQELQRQRDVDRLLAKVADLVFRVIAVERVVILLLDDGKGIQGVARLVPRVARDRAGPLAGAVPVPQSIARRAVDERVAIVSDDALEDERFQGHSVILQVVRSAMCVPLLGEEERVLGLLYLDNSTARQAFSAEDLRFMLAFAGNVALAIENQQLGERARRSAVVEANFRRFFAPDVAARIAAEAGEIRLGGTRARVAILFSDIRGFTRLAERLAPDEIASLLNEYFTAMVRVVFRHQGTLDKFIGDALLAVWGVPRPGGDEAGAALAAAREMGRELALLNETFAPRGRRLAVGIGLGFGEVFAGNLGSDERLEFTVIGDAVNIAARLCSAAGPGEILLAEDFYRQLRPPPRATVVGDLTLRGREEAVRTYRLAG